MKDKSLIPSGHYCYKIIGHDVTEDGIPFRRTHVCPYWYKDTNIPDQLSGYCRYLETGDWIEGGTDLLWDQVKECGENIDEDY